MPKILENTREVILEKAKSILYSVGYDNLTMRRISNECNIAVGTLYNYFPTKREITIQIMEDYWKDYLITVDEIDNSEKDFYTKLRLMYEKLQLFVTTFMTLISSLNVESMHPYKEEKLASKKAFTETLINKLDAIIIKTFEASIYSISLSMDSHELAKFIVLNFVMMSHLGEFDYKSFEKILKKLLQ